jgi:hypothetical protein
MNYFRTKKQNIKPQNKPVETIKFLISLIVFIIIINLIGGVI